MTPPLSPGGRAKPIQKKKAAPTFEWTRSETLALALHTCTLCHGSGLLPSGRKNSLAPCKCVLRMIFRICFERFMRNMTQERSVSHARMEASRRGPRPNSWGRKDEEYIADFVLVSKRTLDAQDWKLVFMHFLLGADWRMCCRQLRMDRGNFFHAVYRIQQKLGRVFRELQPYGLYPLDEYYSGESKLVMPEPRLAPPLRGEKKEPGVGSQESECGPDTSLQAPTPWNPPEISLEPGYAEPAGEEGPTVPPQTSNCAMGAAA